MLDFLRRRSESEHKWVEDSLSAYMDGELSPKERARVEKHLRDCQACTANLATLRQTVALVRELPRVPAPRSFAIRPAVVQPKASMATPAWGYGLLKGATALAALLLVLLIGADVSLQFLGGFRMAAPAPLAPGAEAPLAPAAPPTIGPTESGEEFMASQAKGTAPPAAEAPPWNAQGVPTPAATEADQAYLAPAPQDTATSELRISEAEVSGTPTAVAEPAEAPLTDEEGMGAGAPELTATPVVTPALGMTAMPPEQEVEKAEVSPAPAPTATPQVVAMVDQEEGPASVVERFGLREVYPLSPLRLAELVVAVIVVLLVPVTVVASWLVRRRG